MDVPVVHQRVVQPPDQHLGYHQPPPIPLGEDVYDQTIRAPGRIIHRHVHHMDHAVPPAMPIIATPPPQIEQHIDTVRVPITTQHRVSLPTPVVQERTVMQPVERTVYETHEVPETVYETHEVPETIHEPVQHTVAVPTTRTEMRVRQVPRTVYDEVHEPVEVPDVRYETHTDHVPRTVYRQETVPRTVMRQQTLPRTVVDQVPTTVRETVMQQTPATVAVTHY